MLVVGLLIVGCSQSGGIEDVKLGMSYDEVRSIMGEPIEITGRGSDVSTQWLYKRNLIYFVDGRVSGDYDLGKL